MRREMREGWWRVHASPPQVMHATRAPPAASAYQVRLHVFEDEIDVPIVVRLEHVEQRHDMLMPHSHVRVCIHARERVHV